MNFTHMYITTITSLTFIILLPSFLIACRPVSYDCIWSVLWLAIKWLCVCVYIHIWILLLNLHILVIPFWKYVWQIQFFVFCCLCGWLQNSISWDQIKCKGYFIGHPFSLTLLTKQAVREKHVPFTFTVCDLWYNKL